MRLASILALLALPALVRAQVAAGVFEPTPLSGSENRYRTDKIINLEECDPAQNVTIDFRWNVQPAAGQAFRSGVFRVYASNKQPAATTTGGLALCETDKGVNNDVFAGKIGDDIDTGVAGFAGGAPLSTSAMVSASGKGCTAASDTQTIYVCVHYHPNDPNGVPGAVAGVASGTLTLYTTTPNAPTLDSVGPGDGRLEAHWTEASSGTDAVWFRVIARVAGTAPIVSTGDSQGSRGWVEGLMNGTTYDVSVLGLSIAGNPSSESASLQGVPVITYDFWQQYEQAGGQEQGGCGSGAAGPVALLGLAAALARVRARRRS